MDQSAHNTPIPSQGPAVGIVIVLIVLVIGAFYFFTRLSTIAPIESETATTTGTEEILFAPTTSSDEPTAIENDLNAEDFSSIDAELEALDAEFAQ